MKELDCRRQSCPQPVLMTRNFLAEGGGQDGFCVLVDNMTAAENVRRFLENAGFSCTLTGRAPDLRICTEDQRADLKPVADGERSGEVAGRKILVMLANDRIGRGDPVLGTGLMKNFITTLLEMGESLWRIVCVNEGVALTVEGAASLESLKALESRGVGILVCGTCLAHYGLTEKRAVGTSTNMLDIVTSLEVADRVITF